ncbi:hypothetical protein [Ferrimonas marina]|uniref:Uncharacterized protein n=1 Tax=Ferrimonas marina TaxID=299255 RepID=A0A1M5TUB1_9GAMM|nr:hypothetical protein [Ferrimonas marina]SHH54405.1 hypothetical protein SAMN02745129_2283 [Ferrimonas marina]
MSLSHTELCLRAARWLKSTMRCQVSFAELDSGAGERPDAWGLNQGLSILVEVKTSRRDFFKDATKPWREVGSGMGMLRYFLTPKGLIKPEELPKGWGLVEATAKQLRIVAGVHPKLCPLYPSSLRVHAPEFLFEQRDVWSELYALASVIRRVEARTGDVQAFTKLDPDVGLALARDHQSMAVRLKELMVEAERLRGDRGQMQRAMQVYDKALHKAVGAEQARRIKEEALDWR